MKKALLILALFVWSINSFAEGFLNEEQTKAFSERLMEHIIKKDFEAGFDQTKKYWPIPEVEVNSMVNQINQQWLIVDQRFGKAIGYELIKKERIGKSFLRYYYLHKFENHAIYWQIDFYKPREEWKINQIIFLDTLQTLYE